MSLVEVPGLRRCFLEYMSFNSGSGKQGDLDGDESREWLGVDESSGPSEKLDESLKEDVVLVEIGLEGVVEGVDEL